MTSQKGSLLLVLPVIVVLLLFVIGGYFYLVYLPGKQIKEYVTQSKDVLEDLDKEIARFKDEDFLALKDTKFNYDDAKKAHEVHEKNLENSVNKVASLSTEYKKIKILDKAKGANELVEQQFETVSKIQIEYGKDIAYRQRVFKAFGDKFLQTLDSFAPLYYQGGDRVQFILLTNQIGILANQTLIALENITPTKDTEADLSYRKSFVKDIRDSFKQINEYYLVDNDQGVGIILGELSEKTKSDGETFSRITENYIRDSEVSKSIADYENRTVKVQEILNTL